MNTQALKEMYKTFLTENHYKIELEVMAAKVNQITATKVEKTIIQIYLNEEEDLNQVVLIFTQGTS